VILNLTNFETFLPEKRPFFLEGIDAFSFPLQVFYSRASAPRPPAVGRDGQISPTCRPRHDLRRREGGRPPGPGLDARRAQRHHGARTG
jgi:hypothetical protein